MTNTPYGFWVVRHPWWFYGVPPDSITHRVRVIVVNGLHLWECSGCGGRWTADVPYLRIEREVCRP